jgi:hypothetical protein
MPLRVKATDQATLEGAFAARNCDDLLQLPWLLTFVSWVHGMIVTLYFDGIDLHGRLKSSSNSVF